MQSTNPFRVAADEKILLPDAQYPPPGSLASGSNQDDFSEDCKSSGKRSLDHAQDHEMRGYTLDPYEGNAMQQAAWPSHSPPSYSKAPSTSSDAVPRQFASQPYIPPEAHTGVMSRSSGPSGHYGSAANKGLSRKPLDPLPPSFSRPIAPHLGPNAYGGYPQLPGFLPMRLYSKEKTLDHGFPILLPPCVVQPHPFSQRDVLEADWIRFLEDLQLTARLSTGQKLAADVLPVMRLGLIRGLLISRVVEKQMRRRKKEPVGDLVDTWNEHFFHARRLHVILAQGPGNISGEVDGPAPDWQHGRSRSSSCSSSGSSSSFDGTHHGLMSREERRHRRKAERRHHKQERREKRRERREERRGRREERWGLREGKGHDKYRLVIVSS